MGWPTFRVAGRMARRARISPITSSLLRSGALEVHVDLGGVDALRVLVELRAARAAPDGDHLRDVPDEVFRHQPQAVTLCESDARIVARLMVSVPSLKGGRKARGSRVAA
jgi:hypothetical protein